VEWIAQNWRVLVAVAFALLVLFLMAVRYRRTTPRPRHTGERIIRVVGVGGAGGNAVDDMIDMRLDRVDYVVINTDGQVLEQSIAQRRIRIGDRQTHGLGAGGDPAIGRTAAEEDAESIRAALEGADLVFVAAGLGGGTGSGAAPLVAAAARELGALTVGVVTLPFAFEGPLRRSVADAAEIEMLSSVDTLLAIENDRANELVTDDTSVPEAFRMVNEVLARVVRGVVDIMTVPGLVNLDFADVRAVMHDAGVGLAGVGRASGDDRAVTAARAATTSPLLSRDIRGAQRILLNVTGSSRLALREVIQVAEAVREAAHSDAKLIFGATFDDRMKDDLWVTVIATGFAEAIVAVDGAGTEPPHPDSDRPAEGAVVSAVAGEAPVSPQPRRSRSQAKASPPD
jgi:cell division protein FtsZ